MMSRPYNRQRWPGPARPPTYVRDIPLPNRQQICRILDCSQSWTALGALLGFDNDQIQIFRQALHRVASSPTDEMLTVWDYSNHTITELFKQLYEMNNARCMMLLKDFVDPKLHYLIEKIQGVQPTSSDDNTLPVHPGYPTMPPVSFVQGSDGQLPNVDESPNGQSTLRPAPQQATQGSWNDQKTSTSPPAGQQAQRPNQGLTVNMNKESAEKVIGLDSPFKDWAGGIRSSSSVDNKSAAGMQESLTSGGSGGIGAAVQQDSSVGEKEKLENYQNQSALGLLIHFRYEEIVKATHDFSDAYKLGEGSFGTVYYAVIKMSHYAVKRMKQNESMGFETDKIARADQMKELRALSTYRNANIVSLYAYCFDGPAPCLVYEFMENGSLEDNLLCRGQRGPLNWQTRHRIAEGSALGINFLHKAQDQPLIHGDIKSANILLGSHYEPKIADFGLARLGPENGKTYCYLKTEKAHGTMPYLPEEFKRNFKLSTKVDVFSFGVVLMEILSGERVFDSRREPNKLLTDMVEETLQIEDAQSAITNIRDRRCSDWPWDIAWLLLDIAVRCTAAKFTQRPEINKVVNCLRDIDAEIARREDLQKQEIPRQESFRRSPDCLPNLCPQGSYTEYNADIRYPVNPPEYMHDTRYDRSQQAEPNHYHVNPNHHHSNPGYESGLRKHNLSESSSDDNNVTRDYRHLDSSYLSSSCDMSSNLTYPPVISPGQVSMATSMRHPDYKNPPNSALFDPRFAHAGSHYANNQHGYPSPAPQHGSRYQPTAVPNGSPQPRFDSYPRPKPNQYPNQTAMMPFMTNQQQKQGVSLEDHIKRLDISQLPTKPMAHLLKQEPSSHREPEQNTDILLPMKDKSPRGLLESKISEEGEEEGSALKLSLTTTQMKQFLPLKREPTQQTEKINGAAGKQTAMSNSDDEYLATVDDKMTPMNDTEKQSRLQSSLTTLEMKQFLSSKREPSQDTEFVSKTVTSNLKTETMQEH